MSEEAVPEESPEKGTEQEVRFHSDELDHGFFQLTLPLSISVWLLWGLAVLLLGGGFIFYMISLDTADAVPVDEAIRLVNPEQPHDLKQLGLGFDEGEKGAWLYLEGRIVKGTLATGDCVQDDEGKWSSVTRITGEGLTIQPHFGNEYQVWWTDRTWSPEMNEEERSCPYASHPWTVGVGDSVTLFVLDDGETLWLFSAGEGSNPPSEVTDREDGQRWAMSLAALGCVFLMMSTPTSLSRDLNKFRKGRPPRPVFKFIDGTSAPAGNSTRKVDDHDWVLPPPKPDVILSDPWASGPDEDLIPEHPNVIGTPTPATLTLYSISAIGFVTFSIWLAADLLARHGSYFHNLVGNILRYGIVLFTVVWLAISYKNWKFIHNLRDTPTSSIRSIAVGPAEVVGQALPMPTGTLTARVGEHETKEVGGCLAYNWTEEKLVGSGKNRRWKKMSSGKDVSRFIIHDGTGGIIVEPDTFKQSDWGNELASWESGRWRWSIHAITAFDPVYCLGRVEKREADDLAACPSDKSVQQSLLVMRGNKDVGMQASLSRGTELGLLKRTRSTLELLIVPLLMFISAAIPFIW